MPYSTVERTLFSFMIPIIYSFFNIAIKYSRYDITTKTKHIAIMSAIGSLKGLTIDYKEEDGYIGSAIHEGIKCFLKFSIRSECYNMYSSKTYISKGVCISTGTFISYMYNSGTHHLDRSFYKSVLTTPFTLLADHIKKFLEPGNSNQLLITSDIDEGLYNIISNEYNLLWSNIAHSITLGFGKEVTAFIMNPTTHHKNKITLSADTLYNELALCKIEKEYEVEHIYNIISNSSLFCDIGDSPLP